VRLILLLLLFFWNDAAAHAAEGLPGSASASGPGFMVIGPNPADMNNFRPIEGTITISTRDMGNRWSHVQNTDLMDVIAEFSAEEGSAYKVVINRPMPRHPLGKYTTWFGVVYWHEMHGDTGIGTQSIPKVKPDIALWGWAEVSRDGQVIASMVPAHVMVMTQPPMQGIMLEVATEDKNLPGVPDGYITAMWPTVASIRLPTTQVYARQIAGWVALVVIVLIFGGLTYIERSRAEAQADRKRAL
jgi:hypothetical protein